MHRGQTVVLFLLPFGACEANPLPLHSIDLTR